MDDDDGRARWRQSCGAEKKEWWEGVPDHNNRWRMEKPTVVTVGMDVRVVSAPCSSSGEAGGGVDGRWLGLAA